MGLEAILLGITVATRLMDFMSSLAVKLQKENRSATPAETAEVTRLRNALNAEWASLAPTPK